MHVPLIRRDFTRALRRLIHRRQRVIHIIRRRRRGIALHRIPITRLRCSMLSLPVPLTILRHGILIAAACPVVRIPHLSSSEVLPYHPAVVAEGRETTANAAFGVPVAKEEEERKGAEEE